MLTSSIFGQSLPFAEIKKEKKEAEVEQPKDPIVYFTPPPGWMIADPSALSGRVRMMIVGKAPSNFPPSLNLTSEPYQGTLKQYLKIVKNINDAKGYEWKDLGTIKTDAGIASLSQVDTKSQWGTVRQMHVIIIKNGTVYLLTAAALKEEFSIFYKEFFAAMRSLKITHDLYELIPDSKERIQLKNAVAQLKKEWETLVIQNKKENPQLPLHNIEENVFQNDPFQKTIWKPFTETLKQTTKSLGEEWQTLFLNNLENQLFHPSDDPS